MLVSLVPRPHLLRPLKNWVWSTAYSIFVQMRTFVRCSYQLSHWSSGIGAQDRWHLSIDTVRFSGWISLRLGKLCMISTEVLCHAATSKLGNSNNYSLWIMPSILCSTARAPVAQLVRASDRNSEDPGSNPGWISMSFFAMVFPCYILH